MFRIDNPTASTALPSIPAVGVAGYFTKGNPATGVSATIVDDWWLNTVQEEILTVIVNAGLLPNKLDHTQLYQALQRMFGQHSLAASVDFYVSTTGADSNDGATAGTPWLTLNHAAQQISKLYTSGYQITVHVAPGTYSPCLFYLPGVFGGGSVLLQATDGTPANTVLVGGATNQPTIQLGGSGGLTVNGFHITNTLGTVAPSRIGVSAQEGGNITFTNCDFGPCSDAHIACFAGGLISNQFGEAWSISGGATQHIFVQTGGVVNVSSSTISITAPVSFAEFVIAKNGGALAASSVSFSGAASVTGQRYLAQNGGVIDTGGGGPNYFPGNSAGDSSTGYYT